MIWYGTEITPSSETTKILKELFVSLGFKKDDLKTRSFGINTKYESYKAKDQSWKKRLIGYTYTCLLYTSPSPRDRSLSRMPSSA